MKKEKKRESAMKVSMWSLWRIVGAGFACSGEWVSGALYFWSLTAIWIREPEVPGKEPPTLTSCWRSPARGHWANPILSDNAHTCTHACILVHIITCTRRMVHTYSTHPHLVQRFVFVLLFTVFFPPLLPATPLHSTFKQSKTFNDSLITLTRNVSNNLWP